MKTFATRPRLEPKALRPCASCASLHFRSRWDLGAFSFVTCRDCGLVQQNPQPLREAVLARYDESYLAYETERQFDYAALERKAFDDLGLASFEASVLSAAGPGQVRSAQGGRRPRVLDIGCATGALLHSFSKSDWDRVGVEPCAPAAAYGRERFGLDIRAAILEECSFEDGEFDLVHASHLIEHLNDPAAFLAETGRILSRQGRLILTTPNIDGLQARLLGPGWRSAIYDHLYLFSKGVLRGMLHDAGFRVLRLSTWGGWAAGLRPAWLKKPLDRFAKRTGTGDVMALLCAKEDR
jgi:SAM-dependent methyltransferase